MLSSAYDLKVRHATTWATNEAVLARSMLNEVVAVSSSAYRI